jgi:hypothetical protein
MNIIKLLRITHFVEVISELSSAKNESHEYNLYCNIFYSYFLHFGKNSLNVEFLPILFTDIKNYFKFIELILIKLFK